MSACPACNAWNAPLAYSSVPLLNGGSVALRFEQWIVYHWHVAMHQAGNWGGELEKFDGDIMKFVAQLKAA